MTPPSAPSDSVPPSAHAPRRHSWLRPRLDWLLVFVPVAIALRFLPSLENATALFVVSCLAIVPLAGWMGRATEHLAEHLGPGIGGFLNATFGNAAELIIGLFALSKGLTGVVKASITGSIIGNILLVLGLAFLSGGIKFRKQEFSRVAAGVSATASATPPSTPRPSSWRCATRWTSASASPSAPASRSRSSLPRCSSSPPTSSVVR